MNPMFSVAVTLSNALFACMQKAERLEKVQAWRKEAWSSVMGWSCTVSLTWAWDTGHGTWAWDRHVDDAQELRILHECDSSLQVIG